LATIAGLSHAIGFEHNSLLYVLGYRNGGHYLRRSQDMGVTWMCFADGEIEHLVAAPADDQRAALVKMSAQGRALVVGVANFPDIDVYVSCDDGETWQQEAGPA